MENDMDIIEFQDRVGYVDTGLSQPTLAYATPVSSHIVIKEPKPQKQVPILDKKRSKPEQEPKVSFLNSSEPQYSKSLETKNEPLEQQRLYQQQQQQYPKTSKSETLYQNVPSEYPKNNSYQRTPEYLYQPIKNPDYQHKKPQNFLEETYKPGMKGKERATADYYATTTTTTKQNREIKELMVSKLYELADMISHITIDEPPRPTPSKSDPSYYQRPPPMLHKKSNRVMHHPSPEARQRYNKSADATYRQSDYYHHHYGYPYQDYYPEDYHYYYEPPRLRRKSIGNQQEEQPLRRKGSRGNMKRTAPMRQQPQEYHPQYDNSYYYPYHDQYYR